MRIFFSNSVKTTSHTRCVGVFVRRRMESGYTRQFLATLGCIAAQAIYAQLLNQCIGTFVSMKPPVSRLYHVSLLHQYCNAVCVAIVSLLKFACVCKGRRVVTVSIQHRDWRAAKCSSKAYSDISDIGYELAKSTEQCFSGFLYDVPRLERFQNTAPYRLARRYLFACFSIDIRWDLNSRNTAYPLGFMAYIWIDL